MERLGFPLTSKRQGQALPSEMGIVYKYLTEPFSNGVYFKIWELGTDSSLLGGRRVRAFPREHLWNKSLVTSSLLIVFAGLLQKDPGLSLDSGVEEDRLFCCPNDSFHIPHWLEERGLYQADVLPAPPGLHLELWWYHGLCLLQSPSRYVWNLCWGGFTSRHADLCLEFRG